METVPPRFVLQGIVTAGSVGEPAMSNDRVYRTCMVAISLATLITTLALHYVP